MRHRPFVLTIILAAPAAACAVQPASPPLPSLTSQAEAQVASPVQAPPPTPDRPVASLEQIAGEWDIVHFDGHSPPRLDNDGQRHAYVDIGPRGLRFAISCNHSGMAGRIEGGVLYQAPDDQGMTTEMACGPVMEARDSAFFDLFRARPQVSLLSDGRVRMTTPDHDLLLERATVRRLAMGPSLSEITGTWRVVGFTRFEGGGYRGWGAMFAPGRLHIADGRLSYSRCPTVSVPFAYTPDFVLRRHDGGAPAAAVECPGVTPAPTEVEPMLAALLGQSPQAERVNADRFVLRSGQYFVLLTSEAAYQREFGEWAPEWERRPGV